jgi:hypothetical protein
MATWPRGALLKFLETMDATSVAPCLRKSAERQWLETDIWELQYRLDHVAYHTERLMQMVCSESDAASSPGKLDLPESFAKASQAGFINARLSSQSSSVSWDPNLSFELSALLSAARSALDVLARISARFFKGYSSSYCSMGDLGKKLLDYEGDEPLLLIIRNHWNRWIDHLCSYRDELVHRTTLRTKQRKDKLSFNRGCLQRDMSVTFEDVTKTTHAPIVIPRNPKRRIITREHVMMHDEWYRDEGYMTIERQGSVQLPDGTEFTIEMERRFETVPTYIQIDEFCSRIHQNLDDFTMSLIEAWEERLQLQPIVVRPRRK